MNLEFNIEFKYNEMRIITRITPGKEFSPIK